MFCDKVFCGHTQEMLQAETVAMAATTETVVMAIAEMGATMAATMDGTTDRPAVMTIAVDTSMVAGI